MPSKPKPTRENENDSSLAPMPIPWIKLVTKYSVYLLIALVCLGGCAQQNLESSVWQRSPNCPPPAPIEPIDIPALEELPATMLQASFLQRLESRMFLKPSEPTPSE